MSVTVVHADLLSASTTARPRSSGQRPAQASTAIHRACFGQWARRDAANASDLQVYDANGDAVADVVLPWSSGETQLLLADLNGDGRRDWLGVVTICH